MYDELINSLRYEASFAYLGSDEKRLAKMMRDAADAIEELQQIANHYEEESKGWWLAACDAKEERERLKEQIPKWIPVSERLPKNDEFVIVTVKDERGDYPYIYSDFGWYFAKAECWIVDNEKRNDITHWMPLPKPPKEEE